MMITVSLNDILVGLLLLAATGTLVALMVVLIKAIPGIKDLNRTLENAAKLTDEAVEGVAQAKELVSTLQETAGNFCETAKGKAGSIKTAIEFAKGAAGLVNILKKKDSSQEDKK